MSNLQLFPVSSLLIGSTLLVDSVADGTTALINLERGWVQAPGEPDCACLFRLLESILCSVREDSCYYNSVLFFRQHSIILPHLRESKIPFSPLKSLVFGISSVTASPTFTTRVQGWFTQFLRKWALLCYKTELCLCAETPQLYNNYITVSMVVHFGEHLGMFNGT